MEIVGIGTDIVECPRIRRMIEQYGELFLTRVYTDREVRYCHSKRRTTENFAGRWAAKEAVLKALGAGWRHGISWRDIEIRNDASGQPKVAVRGVAKEIARRLRLKDLMVSISHCRTYAVAHAIAIREAGSEKPKRGGSESYE